MLFNSYPFLCAFLPITLIGFYWIAPRSRRMALLWLTFASLCFYAYWNIRYVPLLLLSILFNFSIGRLLANARALGRRRAVRLFLFVGVAVDLLLLAYYKYAGFFVANADNLIGVQWTIPSIVLPLGISFFTFTQIAYLVDASRGKAKEYDPVGYALFVSYFPHLIAGPILHHGEMLPQFRSPRTFVIDYENLARGASFFAIGLFKKVILADEVARYVAPVFNAASTSAPLTIWEAWGGALAYTLQLYFDFSGYCDMAIGLSWLFNVKLPYNFNSPYKAHNIIDFWRRWHITLSKFLRDYLYIALGGNRRGAVRRYINLLLTMLLGGLWHGASWSFVVWGGLHGVYLMANHAWNALRGDSSPSIHVRSKVSEVFAHGLTLVAVIVAWVFFRADNLDSALRLLSAMFGGAGVVVPGAIAHVLPAQLLSFLGPHGLHVGSMGVLFGGVQELLLISALLVVCLFLPNSQEIVERTEAVGARAAQCWHRVLRWAPTRTWAAALGLAMAWSILQFDRVTEFLYFQF